MLAGRVAEPAASAASLDLCVASAPTTAGAWQLRVYAGDHLLDDRVIQADGDRVGWRALHYDLRSYRGLPVRLETHRAEGTSPAGYWAYARLSAGEHANESTCSASAASPEEETPGDEG